VSHQLRVLDALLRDGMTRVFSVIPGRSPLGERTRNLDVKGALQNTSGFRVRAEEARPGMTAR
jgi:hypothetical protein